MVTSLKNNPSIQKSSANLRAMGLQVSVLSDKPEEVFMFVNLDSLCKVISKRIVFQNKLVTIEPPYMVVKLWKET